MSSSPSARSGAARALAPRFWPVHLVGVALVAIAVGLGLWQFDGWQERRALEARDLTTATPVPLADAFGPDDPFPGSAVGRPVEVRGTWVPEGTVYVTGREQDGETGAWAVTPVAVGDPGGPALPVVRGWLPDPAEAPAPPTGDVALVAWLQPPQASTSVVDEDPGDDLLPQLRIADLVQHVDRDLYGGYGVATEPIGDLAAAELADEPDAGRFTALRNFFYGVEWWVFAAFAAVIWFSWVRDRLRQEDAAEDADRDPAGEHSVPSSP